jgi:hypothetical protein
MKFQGKLHYFISTFSKFISANKKNINKAFAIFLTAITLFSTLPLFSDSWRRTLVNYFSNVRDKFPEFTSYFYDSRAFIFYTIGVFIWVTLIYYKFEVRFLNLALQNKREISEELSKIFESLPKNHTFFILLGKLEKEALDLMAKKGSDIISAIDKNIKKYEKVYWISGNEIGIIFYEANDRPQNNIVEFVLKRKLLTEIGDTDANLFLSNFKYAIIKIEKVEELHKLESKARAELANIEEKEKQALNEQPIINKKANGSEEVS